MKKKTSYKRYKKFEDVSECELRQLQKGTYFRVIDRNGKVSKETYTKNYYDRSSKKYVCDKHSDVWGNGRALKGTQKVTTNFYY